RADLNAAERLDETRRASLLQRTQRTAVKNYVVRIERRRIRAKVLRSGSPIGFDNHGPAFDDRSTRVTADSIERECTAAFFGDRAVANGDVVVEVIGAIDVLWCCGRAAGSRADIAGAVERNTKPDSRSSHVLILTGYR